jgi:hypothetical protein
VVTIEIKNGSVLINRRTELVSTDPRDKLLYDSGQSTLPVRSKSRKEFLGQPAERSSDMADKSKNISWFHRLRGISICGENQHSQAVVLNAAGKFEKASPESIAEACNSVEEWRWNSFPLRYPTRPEPILFPIRALRGFICALHRLTQPVRLR